MVTWLRPSRVPWRLSVLVLVMLLVILMAWTRGQVHARSPAPYGSDAQMAIIYSKPPDGHDRLSPVAAQAGAVLLGVVGGLAIHLLVWLLQKHLPSLATGMGLLSGVGIAGVSLVMLAFLGNPYAGETHSDLLQLLVALWGTVLVLSLLRGLPSPFSQHMGPVFIKAALTGLLLLAVWDIDLGWEYVLKQRLLWWSVGAALLTQALLDSRHKRAG